jgi:hypothetical protein
MNWRIGIYGSSSSTRAQRFSAHVLLAAALLSFYGLWTEFVPSAFGASCGLWLSWVTTLPLSLFLWRGYSTGKILWGRRPKWLINRLLCLAAIPIMIFGLVWVITVRAVPDLLTRIVETQTSTNMILHASHEWRRHSCDYQLRGNQLSFPGYICVSPSQFNQFPEYGEVTLSGLTTTFGMHVSHVEVVRANKPLRPIARENARSG